MQCKVHNQYSWLILNNNVRRDWKFFHLNNGIPTVRGLWFFVVFFFQRKLKQKIFRLQMTRFRVKQYLKISNYVKKWQVDILVLSIKEKTNLLIIILFSSMVKRVFHKKKIKNKLRWFCKIYKFKIAIFQIRTDFKFEVILVCLLVILFVFIWTYNSIMVILIWREQQQYKLFQLR